MIDGGYRPDATILHLPLHDLPTLTEAFRRAVLKMFVGRELKDIETAQGMLIWTSGHVHFEVAYFAGVDGKSCTAGASVRVGGLCLIP